jgi:hypothetical protein
MQVLEVVSIAVARCRPLEVVDEDIGLRVSTGAAVGAEVGDPLLGESPVHDEEVAGGSAAGRVTSARGR